ncbi:MAG: Hsp20/alpha crystallin family protein [Candidatus Rokubacteria bacterium]|nr:Hsp20/alpha crystallin family protein [Candidatus Rokubacteria bacterium]
MNALKPWAGMGDFREEMERFFDRFALPRWEEMPALGQWSPRLDMTETKDVVIVRAEMPGVEQNDIGVSLQDQTLTVKGEKRQEKEEKDERYHRVERSYGSFLRAVRLPVAVDGTKVSATFKNGVLTVTLPKAMAAKGTTIPVKAE